MFSTHREPEFPMRFIGTFGLAKDPIAVFEGNGEVVNAKIGERERRVRRQRHQTTPSRASRAISASA